MMIVHDNAYTWMRFSFCKMSLALQNTDDSSYIGWLCKMI